MSHNSFAFFKDTNESYICDMDVSTQLWISKFNSFVAEVHITYGANLLHERVNESYLEICNFAILVFIIS